jgi:hypothetical protein
MGGYQGEGVVLLQISEVSPHVNVDAERDVVYLADAFVAQVFDELFVIREICPRGRGDEDGQPFSGLEIFEKAIRVVVEETGVSGTDGYARAARQAPGAVGADPYAGMSVQKGDVGGVYGTDQSALVAADAVMNVCLYYFAHL